MDTVTMNNVWSDHLLVLTTTKELCVGARNVPRDVAARNVGQLGAPGLDTDGYVPRKPSVFRTSSGPWTDSSEFPVALEPDAVRTTPTVPPVLDGRSDAMSASAAGGTRQE